MKRANFEGRKQKRREGALVRLVAGTDNPAVPAVRSAAQRSQEIATLKERLANKPAVA